MKVKAVIGSFLLGLSVKAIWGIWAVVLILGIFFLAFALGEYLDEIGGTWEADH